MMYRRTYFVDGREQLGAVIICSRIIKYYITRGRENKGWKYFVLFLFLSLSYLIFVLFADGKREARNSCPN